MIAILFSLTLMHFIFIAVVKSNCYRPRYIPFSNLFKLLLEDFLKSFLPRTLWKRFFDRSAGIVKLSSLLRSCFSRCPTDVPAVYYSSQMTLIRDSKGISKLSLTQLIVPYKISFIFKISFNL